MTQDESIVLSSLRECFEGAIPAIIATSSAAGIPNVTYLSRVRYVDEEHVALSNQFFSKTVRNLAENPVASVVLVDPTTYDEYRLKVVFERTVRRGAIFDRLREDVDEAAAFHNMQGVFKLKAADIFRVVDVALLNEPHGSHPMRGSQARPEALGELIARLSRCPDLDTLVGATVDGLHDLLGYSYSLLLLLDESGERLFTIASRGYTAEGVGSEVRVGEGTIGMAAARAAPMRVGNLRQMRKYSTSVRKSFEEEGMGPGRDVPLPGLDGVESRLAVPAIALGELVGVLAVESDRAVAFNHDDESLLSVVASFLASAIEIDRARERESPEAAAAAATGRAAHEGAATRVRYFAVDGSIFLDGDYLIRGVAGRILWSLLEQHLADGRIDFTNKEIRLDRRLELPGFRDNLDTRLILLKRRLDERGAPIRIEKTGRGRFRLLVEGDVRLESA
jgi:predicted pyridoxine 5'-phosphate oxidase superfamily flavin-nucleotide-binding protein